MDYRDTESVIAIVPMKPFLQAKERLKEELSPDARGELARKLFERTLRILKRARRVGRTIVVSRDPQVLAIARKHNAWAMLETGGGLNEALEQASRVAKANGAQAALVLPADLPGLAGTDVDEMVRLGQVPPCVVIAPDRHDQGTNALLVNPPGLIPFLFGEKSFLGHRQAADLAGARVEIYRAERVAFDLDLPEDARALRGRDPSRC